MSFMEQTAARYTTRNYSDRPVEEEKIDMILEAGNRSPSAKNLQPVRILVARSDDALAKLAKTANLYGAPLGLIAIVRKDLAWKRPFDGKNFGDIDASIVMTQMMYEAQEQGLGTTWIGYFDPSVLKMELSLADDEEVSAVLAVGYRADETSANHGNRIPISEFVKYL